MKFTKVINLSNNIKHICKESNRKLDKLLNKQKALNKGLKVKTGVEHTPNGFKPVYEEHRVK